MAKSVAVLVGTKKGLFVLRSGAARSRWRVEGPHFAGQPVTHASFDPRDGASIYAAVNATWGGPRIEVSRDLGKTWKTAANPAFPKGTVGAAAGGGADGELSFKETWHIEPGHASTPDIVWAGTAPAAIFRSDDRGMTWTLVPGLSGHPSRKTWNPGGAGTINLHSIAVDAADPKKLAVGISAGGVYETRDGGKTWAPRNTGLTTETYAPGVVMESGQCVHHLVAHPTAPNVRFMQAHEGIWWWNEAQSRWDSGGDTGRPANYGFAAAIHPHDTETGYVFPLDWPQRMSNELGVAVYRTRDRGKTWKRMTAGLPKGAPMEVMREGLATDRLDPAGVYFGTNAGEVWASADEGKTWQRAAEYLPPVLSVGTATLV
ncbi:MAG TPA: exo-alpha-sialidase [Candidatus Limnocylindria bacterium]|nr:exo-alpha-sialidase [Candidatus Limnocylindria bacterium]